MDTQENKALANKVIQAIGAGDWTFVEEAFAEDAKVWVAGSMPISGNHGKAFVLASGGRTKAFFPEGMSLTPKALTAEGERVAVEAVSLGKHVSGKIYNNHFHILMVIRDGKVQEWKEYMDTMHANDVFFGGPD
ncbi:nuclear transport factor 2 family protein [Sulfitobacter pontiacus]|uniref:nuclear transport factor 2 family protein n=1 Tax=Sulfitobacter pontiacus TaxID=60137 RepID=UPI0015DF8E49|nr:nuclear transport factor 2 family protein [Sulfitobacter pontiacus]QLL44181.1 SnoaL-like domain-containing protein [Sulfitobacter pontiacus]